MYADLKLFQFQSTVDPKVQIMFCDVIDRADGETMAYVEEHRQELFGFLLQPNEEVEVSYI